MPAAADQASQAERHSRAEERRAAKWAEREARRARNKAEWAENTRNVNFVRAEARAAALPIPTEAAPGPNDGRALQRLRQLMSDQNAPLQRRLECAESVLSFEISAGSLANTPIDAVTSPAYNFLRMIVDAPDAPVPLQVRALKALASVESQRAARADPDATEESRRHQIEMINSARRMRLHEMGLWPLPRADWVLRAGDVFDPLPDAPPAPPAVATMSAGEMLDYFRGLPEAERQRQHAERRRQALSVRIKSRVDPWDEIVARGGLHDPAA